MNSWKRGLACALVACTLPCAAQPKPLRLDFGKRARTGFTLVGPGDSYTPQRGFGFLGSTPKQSGGSVCSEQPFFFAADVAEGNYDVTVHLGGDQSDSATTLKAEARRLLLEGISLPRGRAQSFTFTINLRYAELRSGESVRLKPDEQNDFDWDHRLELEFNGAHPCVQSVEIIPSSRAVTVFIAGDSTVTDQRKEPWAAWGQMLPRFFGQGVAIANHAESGESLKSFIGERRWSKLLETIKPGDYLFLQFAHNDQKPGAAHVDAFTTYQQYLKQFMDEAKSRGATPVLVTSMPRRRFDDAGKIVNTLEDYPDAMRQLAAREHVALVDLNATATTLFETLGPQGTLHAFVHYPAGSFPGQDKPLADDTHFNNYGAYELARCVVEGIRRANLGLAAKLRQDVEPFDPANPDSFEHWKLPTSPEVAIAKPEGN